MVTTKKITKKGTYKININSKSKDMVYTISNAKIVKGVHFNMTIDSSKFDDCFMEKSGNNLMIYSYSDNGKLVTTQITNYYKYYPKNKTILKTTYGSTTKVITPDVVKSAAAYYDSTNGYYNNLNSAKAYVLGKKGKNYYDIQAVRDGETIYDLGGNDTYNIDPHSENTITITDFAGNDKYHLGYETYATVLDAKGNDSYNFYKNYTSNITDNAGNDKYKIFYNYSITTITDKAGNDAYAIDCNDDDVVITDNKGNDKYNITYMWDYVNITDKAGNDKYNAVNAYYDLTITDNKGNDSYSVLYADDDVYITDKAGNDKYKITAVDEELKIEDFKGKDIYNIKDGCDYTYIYDYAGADTYNISNQTEYMYIYDGKADGVKTSGNDKYNLSQIYSGNVYDYYGNDKYNISYNEYMDIKDYHGSDVYNFNQSYGYVYDYGTAEKVGKKTDKTLANDKYNITRSQVTVNDKSGNDVYKFNYAYGNNYYSYVKDDAGKDTYVANKTNLNVADYGSSSDSYTFTNSNGYTWDQGGTDTYKITSSQVTIEDASASKKDSYTVNALNSKAYIKDGGGSGDMLTITSASKGNLIFLADYSKNAYEGNGEVHSGSLFVFDKTKGGYIEVIDFFKKGDENYLTYGTDGKATKGTGYIESVKAGKTALNNTISSYITQSHINNWAGEVSAWLNNEEHSYSSIESLVQNGSEADIKNFIAYCTQEGIK